MTQDGPRMAQAWPGHGPGLPSLIRSAYLKVDPIGKTTSGPIHDQIVGPEGPFKLVVDYFHARGPAFQKSDFWKIGPWV
jgi:hypothetical protein